MTGHLRTSVELFVSDLEESIAFYEQLGFRVMVRRGDWVLIDRGGAHLALQGDAPATAGVHYFTPEIGRRPRGVGVEISIEVSDIDELNTQADALDVIVDEPRDRPWGARDLRVADPDGYYLRFTTPLADVD